LQNKRGETIKHYIQSCEERMKPATPKMTVLQSPVGLRSIVTFLAAFFIVVSTFSLLFERDQQEAKEQMAVQRRNQEMQLNKHHDQQLRSQEAEVQVKVVAEAEHHDQQLRGSKADVKVAAAEQHDQQLRGQEAEAEVQQRAELQDSGEECNWSTGRWVYDNASRPVYSGLNCSFIFPEVACHKYGRKDVMYQHWRWQPHGCDLPR
jgi:hypothetical protein